MIGTIYLILAITQLFIFFVLVPQGIRLGVYMTVKKNPKWVADHPEFTVHRTLERLTTGFSCLLGAVSAAAIVYYTLLVPTPEYYLLLMLRPVQALALGTIVIAALHYIWLERRIPVPEVSKASLSERRISSYIPMWVYWLANISCGIVAVIFGYAYFTDNINQGDASVIFQIFFVAPILVNLVNNLSIRRKHSESDYMFGKKGRRFEVGMMVGLLYLIALLGFNKIYVDFFDGTPFNGDVLLIGLFVFFNLIALFAAVHPKTKALLAEYSDMLAVKK